MANLEPSTLNKDITDQTHSSRWQQNGVTVAGGNGSGSEENQLHQPYALRILNDGTMVIADWGNHRIVKWKKDATTGTVVASGDKELFYPKDVIVDELTDSLIICDGYDRVLKWSRQEGTTQGVILIENISCSGFATDDQRNLYAIDDKKHEVRRFKIGENTGTVVAGGNGQGTGLNQLDGPTSVFVDREYSVYVSDYYNNRVMKWLRDATEGIVVAGGHGQGSELTQLYYPSGLFVDDLETVYVAEIGDNQRVTRWPKGAKEGTIIVGGNGRGKGENQFDNPIGLSFDREGNLYVADWDNHRIQKFSIVIN